MKLSQFRHYFLYAKNHYKVTDRFEDLCAIQRDYIGAGPNVQLTKADIIRVTTRAVEFVQKNMSLEKYVETLTYYGRTINSPWDSTPMDVFDAIIAANLSILGNSTIDEIAGSEGYVLGEADYTILPASEYVLRRMNNV